jgi:phenol 2-monooxygenase
VLLLICVKCDSIDRGALRVFIDDTDASGSFGGGGYSYYGVGAEGALVAVRPDGYVGAIAPLDRVGGLDAYFASFMKTPA